MFAVPCQEPGHIGAGLAPLGEGILRNDGPITRHAINQGLGGGEVFQQGGEVGEGGEGNPAGRAAHQLAAW